MSDLTPHSRNDLNLLPCDTEPAHECSGSRYLCPVCNPRRSLIAAVRDVSAVRDLPLWVWSDLLRPNLVKVVRLADRRRTAGA